MCSMVWETVNVTVLWEGGQERREEMEAQGRQAVTASPSAAF